MQKQYKNEYRKQRPWSLISGRVPTALDLARAAKEAKCDDDLEIKRGIEVVFYTGNQFIAQCLWQEIERRRVALELSGDAFYPPISREEARGDLTVGEIENAGCSFGLKLNELPQCVLVFGSLGMWKTTLMKRIFKEVVSLARRGVTPARLLVFDIKSDYPGLKQLFPEVWVFRPGSKQFKWNPLEPPIPDWRQWAGILSGSMANSMGFAEGQSTANLIYRYVSNLYTKYDPSNHMYPSMFDLLAYLKQQIREKKIGRGSEEFKSFERFKSRMEYLCTGIGETLDCSEGYPMAQILSHHTIFDLEKLGSAIQCFFTENFILQAIWHRRGRGERGGVLRNVTMIDEAKRLIPKFKEDSQLAICNMTQNITMGREFGFGFVAAECHPSKLGDSIKSAACVRFCFNQTYGWDIAESVKTLNLSPEQADEIQCLERGQCIVRVAGRIDRPFKLRVKP